MPFQENTLLIFVFNEANSGFRSGATLKPSAWTHIVEGLEKTIEKRLNQKQLKNGWDYMKRQYQTWTKLTNTTGYGYNSVTRIINWPDERWEEYLKANIL
ncbi:hypothetical protein Dsin_017458 [Dipteronia sinensis]|uniref:Myb/SANT-like domain-containing protein n=1 Tax=Dipteronia sinensis TaxID=43782 RepID=A0AAE0E6Q8_9ROSI|nr:hypothetical protein Dsin_017458 [Dipteronia sinensis]